MPKVRIAGSFKKLCRIFRTVVLDVDIEAADPLLVVERAVRTPPLRRCIEDDIQALCRRVASFQAGGQQSPLTWGLVARLRAPPEPQGHYQAQASRRTRLALPGYPGPCCGPQLGFAVGFS